MARRRSYELLTDWSDREKFIDRRGYVRVHAPEHPRAFGHQGWYYEHRLVAERMLGRLLYNGETVHHINEHKCDNREINLFVCTREEHDKAHQGVYVA
jgi:hypothetical protein